MQVVKIFARVLLLFFSCVICNAQVINGKFKRVDPLAIAKELKVHYKFEPNSQFQKVELGHLSTISTSNGKYSIRGKTLAFHYDNAQDINADNIKVIKKSRILSRTKMDSSENVLFTMIEIKDNLDNPIQGANVLLKNSNEEYLMGFSADENGRIPDINILNRYIKFIQISAFGKHDMIIETEPYFGYRTHLEVVMGENSSDQKMERSEEYFILDMSKNKISVK